MYRKLFYLTPLVLTTVLVTVAGADWVAYNDLSDGNGGTAALGMNVTTYTYLDTKFTDYDNFNLGLGNPYGFRGTTSCADMFDSTTPTNPTNSDCVMSYNLEGNEVPRAPNHLVNLAVRYKPTANWTITGEMNTKSSYYADELNWLDMSGHTTFNLLANYDRKIGDSEWSFFGRVDNLFDKTYYNTARTHGDSKTVDSDGDGDYDTYDGVFNKEDLSLVVNQGITITAGISIRF